MPTSYPGGLDNFSNPSGTDATNSTTVLHSAQHSNANDAIKAIQTALGVNPARGVANVSERFQALEGSVVAEAENLLKSAVWYIDAANSSAGNQTITNLGWGGSTLNAVAGTGTSVDGSDPKYLAWTGENYVYLPGVTGNYLSVADEAALDITGDIDIRVRVAMDDWTPAATTTILSKSNVSNQNSYELHVNTSGTLFLVWSANGSVDITATSTVATGVADGAAKWVRATLDVDNGAVGNDVKFWLSDDGVTWSQLGTTVTTAGATSIFAGTQPITIGTRGNSSRHFAGSVYRAIVKNGIDGPTVLDVDCSQVLTGSATSFAARTGQTVIIARSTSGRKAVAVTQPCWLFGTDDYMSVADSDLLDVGTSGSMTAYAVVRQWGAPTNYTNYLSKYSPVDFTGYAILSAGTARQFATTAATSFAYNLGDLVPVAAVLGTGQAQSSFVQTPAGPVYGTATAPAATTHPLTVGRSSVVNVSNWYYGDFEGVAFAVFRKALTQYEIELLNDYFQSRDAGSDAYQPRKYVNANAFPVGSKGDMAFNEQSQQLMVKQGDNWNRIATQNGLLRSIPQGPPPAETLLKQAVWWIDANHNSASGQTVRNLGWGGSVLDATAGSSGAVDSNDPLFLDFDGTPYVYLPGAASNYMSVPDENALDITGDIDIRAKVALDLWKPSSDQVIVSKFNGTSTRSYTLRVQGTTGKLLLVWTTDGASGTQVSVTSTVAPTVVDGSPLWVRATLDVDNGASGNTAVFYTSNDGLLWAMLGAPVITASATSIYSGSGAVTVGSDTALGFHLPAKIYRAQVLNGINGTPVLDIDTSVLTSGSQTSFTALTGQTVTINRSTSGRKSVAVVSPVWLLGTDDYLEVPDNDLLDFGASDSFTVMAVYRMPSFGATNYILSKGGPDPAVGYTLRNGSGTPSLGVSSTGDGAPYVSRVAGSIATHALVATPTSLTANINGSTSSLAITAASQANSSLLRIGRSAGTAYGDMEFIAAAVFRRALTQDEILTLSSYYQGR